MATAPQHSEVIVLATKPLREADLLVTCLSAAEGKLVGVAPHARRSRRRFGAALQPGTIGVLQYERPRPAALVRCQELQAVQILPARALSLEQFAGLGVLLDLIATTSPEGQAIASRYQLAIATLTTWPQCHPLPALLQFVIAWLVQSGFASTLSQCLRCQRSLATDEAAHLLPEEGGAVCHSCGTPHAWSLPLPPAARHCWDAWAGDDAAPIPRAGWDDAVFRVGLWRHCCHVIGREPASASFWTLLWQRHRAVNQGAV